MILEILKRWKKFSHLKNKKKIKLAKMMTLGALENSRTQIISQTENKRVSETLIRTRLDIIQLDSEILMRNQHRIKNKRRSQ